MLSLNECDEIEELLIGNYLAAVTMAMIKSVYKKTFRKHLLPLIYYNSSRILLLYLVLLYIIQYICRQYNIIVNNTILKQIIHHVIITDFTFLSSLFDMTLF